jgi:hypothetical protein
MSGPSPTVWRIHPDTGEILSAVAPQYPYARAIAIDSSGTLVVSSYNHSGSTGVHGLTAVSGAFEDRSFNSIRTLTRPLIFNNGGNPYLGAIYGYGTINLTWTSQTAMVLSNITSTTVYLLPPSGGLNTVQANSVVVVVDAGGNAGTNNITVNGNGFNVENPASPGSYASSVSLTTSGQVVAWIFDIDNSRYKFLFANGGGSGGGITVDQGGADIGGNPHTVLNFTTNMTATNAGGGVATITAGITVQSAGTGLANNPHTTLNFAGGAVAVDSGSGVATINVAPGPGGYVLVGNANPSTGNLSNTVLQAIVDSSVATTTVNAPDLVSGTFMQQTFRVTDDTGHAATNPITITSGQPLEDPNVHGTYATSVQITVNSQSIDWQWTGSHYKIV